MATDVLSAIHDRLRTFSKGQKLIAGFILQSYDKAAFMTASKLGKTVGVSESTVVRFAVELGFDGYPSMQKTLQEIVRNKLTSVQRIEAANDRIGNQDVVSTVLQADIDTLRRTSETLDRREMDASVDAWSFRSARRAAASSSTTTYFRLSASHRSITASLPALISVRRRG